MASALKADFSVVYVEPAEGGRGPRTIEEERQLRKNLQLADDLGATVVRLRGKVADELATHARERGVTQLIIGHPTHGRWHEFLRGSVTNAILRNVPGIDVHVIAETDKGQRPHRDREAGGQS